MHQTRLLLAFLLVAVSVCRGAEYLVAMVKDAGDQYVIGGTSADNGGWFEVHPHPRQQLQANTSRDNNIVPVGGRRSKASLVSTSDGVTIHAWSRYSQFSPLPTSTLGTKYIVSDCVHSPFLSSVLVVAAGDMITTIKITIRKLVILSGFHIQFVNTLYTTLKPYKTITLTRPYDLTGTVVTSSQNVAVFTGTIYDNNMVTYTQLIPVQNYGREFIVAVDDYSDYVIQVVSETGGVTLTFNNGSTSALDEYGLFGMSVERNGYTYFKTSQPVMTTLCRNSNLTSSFLVVPPLYAYTSGILPTVDNQLQKILVQDTGSDVTVSGMGHAGYSITWQSIPGTGYKIGTCRTQTAVTFVRSTFRFVVLSFVGQQMYSGGTNYNNEMSPTESTKASTSTTTSTTSVITSTASTSTTTSTTTTTKPPTTKTTTTTTKPTTVKPTTAKPTTAKPTTAKPTTAKLTTAKPTTAKPTTAKPTTAKPTTAKPTTAKPTTAKPTTAKPTTAKPTTAKPTTTKPTTAKPTTAKPTTAKPTTAKPTTTKPMTTKPTTAKPTTTKPTTAKPTTAKPTTTKPTTAKPTTAKPTTTKPTTTKPTTTKLTTTKPTTTKPTRSTSPPATPNTSMATKHNTDVFSTSQPTEGTTTSPAQPVAPLDDPTAALKEKDEPNTVLIAGGASGGVLLIIFILLAVIVFMKKRRVSFKKSSKRTSSTKHLYPSTRDNPTFNHSSPSFAFENPNYNNLQSPHRQVQPYSNAYLNSSHGRANNAHLPRANSQTKGQGVSKHNYANSTHGKEDPTHETISVSDHLDQLPEYETLDFNFAHGVEPRSARNSITESVPSRSGRDSSKYGRQHSRSKLEDIKSEKDNSESGRETERSRRDSSRSQRENSRSRRKNSGSRHERSMFGHSDSEENVYDYPYMGNMLTSRYSLPNNQFHNFY